MSIYYLYVSLHQRGHVQLIIHKHVRAHRAYAAGGGDASVNAAHVDRLAGRAAERVHLPGTYA